MSFFDKYETASVVAIVIFVIIAVVGCQVGLSLVAYHWVDRPGHYVDGRWFTLGAFVFWSLTSQIGQSRRSRK